MSDVKNGKETTEYTATVWGGIICSALAAAITSILGSGAVPPDSIAGAILAAAVAVLGAVGGALGVAYTKGRSMVKASEMASGFVAEMPDENPTD